MEENNSRLVVQGNAFYEIDLNCLRMRRKNEKKDPENPEKKKKNRQRD